MLFQIVLLEIKTLETDVDKIKDLGSQPFLYNSVETEESGTTKENKNQGCDGNADKSQILTNTQELTSQESFELNLEFLKQNNKDSSNLNARNEKRTNEGDLLLNTTADFEVINENTAFNSINKDLNSIIVNIDESNKSTSEMGKQNFNYSESLKTPNPDLSDKKLSDSTDYIEDEPATPLLYENMSKDLVEPECNQVKSVSYIKEMIEDNNDDEEAPKHFTKETKGVDKVLNEENASENFIQEIITGENKSTQDLSKSEDFIRSMITGESNTRNPDEHESTKPDDFLHEMLTSNNDLNKTPKERDYLRELITGDTENREAESKQDLITDENSTHKDTPKAEDFIIEIVSGVPKDTTYENNEKESKNIKEYDKDNKMRENESSDSTFDSQIHEEIQGNRTPNSKGETASDVGTRLENITQDKDMSQTPSDNTKDTNQVEKSKDNTPSIAFLSEIPNVTDATNNFMNQIIDTKPKTPSQLNFVDDLNSKQSKY